MELTRGRSFSCVIPVTSALNICIPPDELSIGSTASVNRMIPMPPIHCISERHICTAWLSAALLSITEAPVVVKPDMASKKASDTLMLISLSMNGIIPNAENTTHTMAVSRNPQRLPISNLLGRTHVVTTIPVATVIAMAHRKASKSSSP